MLLTDNIRSILKTFPVINDQIIFTPGTLKIASDDKSLFCFYDWEVELKEQFAVNSLSNFLNTISLYDNPVIEKDGKFIFIKEGSNFTKYLCINEVVVKSFTLPDKEQFIEGKLTQLDNTFELTKSDISKIQKSVSLFQNTHIQFQDSKITTIEYKPGSNTDSFNSYSMEIEGQKFVTKTINAQNFSKIYPDDYLIKLYNNALVMESKNFKLMYVFTLTKIV